MMNAMIRWTLALALLCPNIGRGQDVAVRTEVRIRGLTFLLPVGWLVKDARSLRQLQTAADSFARHALDPRTAEEQLKMSTSFVASDDRGNYMNVNFQRIKPAMGTALLREETIV